MPAVAAQWFLSVEDSTGVTAYEELTPQMLVMHTCL